MPYRDPRPALVQRLAELDAERRDLAQRLALFARPAPPRRTRLRPTMIAIAGALATVAGLITTVQLARIGVRLPSGELVFLFDGQFGTEHAVVDLASQ